jgi:L-ascorbate metabolism protein UlaG (beta-lactamase superfamily)
MQITWKGQSCFQISVNLGKGEQVNIVIDPFDEATGLRVPKLEADLLLISHDHHDHNNTKAVDGKFLLVEGPGEYEAKGVYVQGIPAFHDDEQGKEKGVNTIYVVEAEDLRICHMGDLGQKELTDEQLEKIGDVDVLMIPIGGNFTISAKESMKIMSQIEPRIIIPMHYSLPKLKIKLDGLEVFLKAMGMKKIDPLPKLSIKKKDISAEEAKIIVLEP